MALRSKKLSELEKAVLYYHVFGNIDDWTQLYIIADNTNTDEKPAYFGSEVSKWKNSEKVQAFLQKIKKDKADQDANERLKGREEERKRIEDTERTKNEAQNDLGTITDYSDPENRKRLYNEVIRKAGDDPKTQLDAAKMFEQIQRDDKQAAREQKQVRAYLPLLCHDCPLYQKEQK